MPRTCFVTVGTTIFEDLITAVLSEKTRKSLKKIGIDQVIIQCGSGLSITNFLPEGLKAEDAGCFVGEDGLKIEFFRYKKSIQEEMKSADLIIGHAGAGTALEVLKLHKPMIAVINDKLMDNHQTELADRLSELGHLIRTVPSQLHEALLNDQLFKPKPFEHSPPNRLSNYLTEKLGYINIE
ncbi:hypothetical protein FO519_007359 [Halicephalobus sp. NKZ332]|nr:hypothetical protein FO519_007359 [Halicephalobus sp. NKZ332]